MMNNKENVKCCVEGCDNEIKPEEGFLIIDEPEGYACESCMEKLGDQ